MLEQQIQTTIRLVLLCQRIILSQQITHSAAQIPLTVKTKFASPDQLAGNRSTLSECSASLSPCGLTANVLSKMCPVPGDSTHTIPTSTRPIHGDGAIQFCPTAPGWSRSPVWAIIPVHPETVPVVLSWTSHPKTPLSSEPILPVGYH